MRTKVILTLAAVLMLIVSVVAIGSNMGFKISIPLYAAGTGHTGFCWVALPYYVSYTTASVIWTEINAQTGSDVELDQFQEADGSYLVYDGNIFFDDFNVAPSGTLTNADAILIKSAVSANWIVVGSHNPTMTVPLYASGTGHTGFNWRSIPYHRTAATASALWTEINALTGSDVELDQFVESDGSYLVYDGNIFFDDFNVTPGAPVLIKSSVTNTTWVPAHY